MIELWIICLTMETCKKSFSFSSSTPLFLVAKNRSVLIKTVRKYKWFCWWGVYNFATYGLQDMRKRKWFVPQLCILSVKLETMHPWLWLAAHACGVHSVHTPLPGDAASATQTAVYSTYYCTATGLNNWTHIKYFDILYHQINTNTQVIHRMRSLVLILTLN